MLWGGEIFYVNVRQISCRSFLCSISWPCATPCRIALVWGRGSSSSARGRALSACSGHSRATTSNTKKKRSTRATIHGQRFLWMFKALSEGMLPTPFSALVHALFLILCSKCKYFKLECQVPSAHALTMRGIACGRKVCVS